MQYSLEKFKKNKKIKKNIKVTVAVIIVSLAIVLIALYLANSTFRNFIDVYILRKEIYAENATQLSVDVEKLSFATAFNNKAVTISGNTLTFYTSKGKEESSLEVVLSNPISDIAGKYMVLGDYGGTKVYLINEQSIKWETDIEGSISSINVNKNGYVTVVITGTVYESIVAVYDSDGNKLFNYNLSSNYVVDSAISKDNKYLAIAELDYSKGTTKSQIKIISIGATQSDKDKAIENTYEAENDDIVTNLEYHDNDVLVALFDDYVIKMTTDSSEKLYTASDNTLFLDISKNNDYMKIEKESSSIFKSEYRLKICSTSSSNEKLYALSGSVKELVSCEKVVAVVSGTTVEFINKNGWLIKKYVGDKEIKDVSVSNNLALIIYKDRIDIISL